MRERLIDLLKEAETKVTEIISPPLALDEWLGVYADYLIANGVIVPPVKDGDELFKIIIPEKGKPYVSPLTAKVEPYVIYLPHTACVYYRILPDDIGKTVFLTKEEAEQKLKGGAE